MNVECKMNHSALNNLASAYMKAARQVADRMLTEKIDDQQIPFAEGTLQNVYTNPDDSQAKNGRISIVTTGIYAARLYYNPQYNFNKEFNVNAQGEWWEDWLTGKKKTRARTLFKLYYKRITGRYVK
jgi:hypothetical protein